MMFWPDRLTNFATVLAFVSKPKRLTRPDKVIAPLPVAWTLNSDPGFTATGAVQLRDPDPDVASKLAVLQTLVLVLHSPKLKAPAMVPVPAIPRVT
jgi:hypothetical protein